MLKACLNGGRRREEHLAVPVTPAELAADAVRCAASGVAAVHVHPRDPAGAESLAPTAIADAVTAVRAARRACRSG
ncbi:3-keto-5-aminohexanoate cleavage protein [Micromonospora sp. NPDC048930]|uniref:3-keto-5-aminohexanoate cleavage protein n=1 Tax=Micromonospora sp. NPDC048930 TaxID=3364261 RepID=UPI00371EE285